ncbi:MAG TPA: fatty acid desaturase [Trinickia sp.]|nr:fatty acid desaturase [Trinickia sp.]
MEALLRRVAGRWSADLPSALFLAAAAANTVLIWRTASFWLLVALTTLQALLLVGCQEAKHLSVHGTFFGNRYLNDAIGIVCAALFGVNFVAYRYFHFAHHRATCTQADPEGRLYSLSWPTRWIWLLAPVELPWVAWHIGRTAWPMVPANKRLQRHLALGWMAIFGLLIVAGLRIAPGAVACAYLIPLAMFSWIDFILTQAEHYGVAIVSVSHNRDPRSISHDIVLPFGLGWVTLHRALHRVHHGNPSLRWFKAPGALKADATATPLAYGMFARRWFASGPRLWRTAAGQRANAMLPTSFRSDRRS